MYSGGLISSAYPQFRGEPKSSLSVVTPPADEPTTTDDIKAQINVTIDDDNALLDFYLLCARWYCEGKTGRPYLETEFLYKLDHFPVLERGSYRWDDIRLPRAPVTEVAKVSYLNTDGDWTDLTVNTDYKVDMSSEPARIYRAYGKDWPETLAEPVAVKVEFKAGYDTAADIPPPLILAQKVYAAALYKVREPITDGFQFKEVPAPMSLDSILADWRLYNF